MGAEGDLNLCILADTFMLELFENLTQCVKLSTKIRSPPPPPTHQLLVV